MTAAAIPAALLLAGCGLLVAGCQSTQDKSAEIAAQLGPVKEEKGLSIERRSRDVSLVSKTLLTDAAGSAVVVEFRNASDQDLTGVPVAIDVLNAKGKSVYRNNLPGIERALAAIPFIPGGGEVAWVHDQVLALGKPDSVQVEVGAGGSPYEGGQPDIEISEPRLEGDPISGLSAGGTVTNRTGADQRRLLLYAVARKDGEIVAAGRGAIDRLKAEAKPAPYTIFFIGDPRGAKIEVTRFPTLAAR